MRRTVLFLIVLTVLPAEQAAAAVTPTRSAELVARAMAKTPKVVKRARFTHLPPQGSPVGIGTKGRARFAVLSTGDATLLDHPNEQDDLSTDNEGSPIRGAATDAVILRLDLRAPKRANCLSFQFRFLSEEYDEFVDTEFNDAFLAELGRSTWRSAPGDPRVRARRNFLLDRRRSPISVNGTGAFAVTAPRASGTTYDGATKTLRATKRVKGGRRVRLFLSLFDQGDRQYDSSVILDNLRIDRRRRCPSGAR